jgi:hypothetical protein
MKAGLFSSAPRKNDRHRAVLTHAFEPAYTLPTPKIASTPDRRPGIGGRDDA